MPICCMCHEDKPASAFAFRSIATGELSDHCRECQAAYRRQHYLDNRPIYIAREVARIKRFREQNRVSVFEYLTIHPCVDCGETDVLVLEFDHRDPSTKVANIGYLLARKPWKLVLAEIEKCDVRCANCHRRRTSAQFNWAKARPPLSLVAPASSTDDRAPSAAPEMRICRSCGVAKPAEDYSVKNKKTGRRSTLCRACQARYGREHYRANKPRYLERNRKNKKNNKRRYDGNHHARVLSYLTGKSCVDCGESDVLLLEFDHRDGAEKTDDVARLMACRNWTAVEAEIAKCDVRCANCHRRRTAEQFVWTRFTLQLAARVDREVGGGDHIADEAMTYDARITMSRLAGVA